MCNCEKGVLFGSSGGGPHGVLSVHILGLSGEGDFGLSAQDSGGDGLLGSLFALDEPGVAEATCPSPGPGVGEFGRCNPHELAAQPAKSKDSAGVVVHSFTEGYGASEAVGVMTELWLNGDYPYLPTVASSSTRRPRRVLASRVSA